MLPSSRTEFKQYILRRLGDPVIQINVSDAQVEDRIDEALLYYWQYHYSGTSEQYYKYQVTQTDIDNKYITLPANIIGVVDIFNPDGTYETNNMFSIRYQIMLNDLYTLAGQSLVPYYMMMQQLQLYEEVLVGMKPIRFNVNMGRLYIDMDWGYNLQPGGFLILKCYQTIDPDQFTQAWQDRWLIRYTAALVKQQWGSNLSKFIGVELVGGIKLNGSQIWQEAETEIALLEDELKKQYSGQLLFKIG